MEEEPKWKLAYKGSLENFDPKTSLHYWLDRSPEEKFHEVVQLIEQAMKLKGKSLEDASRLLRTTAVIKRQ